MATKDRWISRKLARAQRFLTRDSDVRCELPCNQNAIRHWSEWWLKTGSWNGLATLAVYSYNIMAIALSSECQTRHAAVENRLFLLVELYKILTVSLLQQKSNRSGLNRKPSCRTPTPIQLSTQLKTFQWVIHTVLLPESRQLHNVIVRQELHLQKLPDHFSYGLGMRPVSCWPDFQVCDAEPLSLRRKWVHVVLVHSLMSEVRSFIQRLQQVLISTCIHNKSCLFWKQCKPQLPIFAVGFSI